MDLIDTVINFVLIHLNNLNALLNLKHINLNQINFKYYDLNSMNGFLLQEKYDFFPY